MTTAISIITCKRDRATYLEQTATALLREGADVCDHRLVFADGDSDPTPPGWELSAWYPRVGPRLMMWRVFEAALKLGVDRLIYCEDDITPCRNAIRYILQSHVPPSMALVDFYANKMPPEAKSPAIYELPARDFCGNLCMVLPRRTIAWLAARDPLSILHDQQPTPGIYTGSDLAMGRLLHMSPWPTYLAHVPRLVRHDGDVSAAHPYKDPRRQPFLGEDFDALTLLPPVVP